ncbi:hypothetical protein JCM6882_008326 [Rhodosporidiobolus microsporus]
MPPSPEPSTGHKPLLPLPKVIKVRESYFYLDDYEEGRRSGGVRAWEEGHQDVIARFYSSPPLVSDKRPHEHQDYLCEKSFAARERGRIVVKEHAQSIRRCLSSTTFEAEYLKPFEAKSVEEREALLLKALADRVRTWDLRRDRIDAEFQRKLVPEFRLDELCSGDGKGLRRLTERLKEHLDRLDIDEHPFPHPDFDRKFALNTPSQLPLSKASRAFQQEFVLVRHSTLFQFLEAIFDTLDGTPIVEEHWVGNFAREMTHENAPTVVPDGLSRRAEREKQGTLKTTEERCSGCGRLASSLGMKELKRCGRCLIVGRLELFCSVNCQKDSWDKHKKTCGKKLSEVCDVPLFNPSTPRSAPPTQPESARSLREHVLHALDISRREYWAIKQAKDGVYGVFGYERRDQRPEVSAQVRDAMRSTAYKALRESDPVSVDVLACCVVPYLRTQDFDPDDVDENDFNPGRPSSNDSADPAPRQQLCKARSAVLIRQQFKEIFDLDDKQLDEAIQRGEKEIKKPGREGELILWQHKELEA